MTGSSESGKVMPGEGSVPLALRYCGRELARLRWLTLPAMLLPALGNIGIRYLAPLVVAELVGRLAGDQGLGVGSALPYVLELLVQEALWRLMEGRTALVVAHRLSTVAGMDSLVVLDRGRIIEQGSHQGLPASRGTYAKLWQHQWGGFLDDSPAAGSPTVDSPAAGSPTRAAGLL